MSRDSSSPLEQARLLFEKHIASGGDAANFEALCAQHPGHASELRRLLKQTAPDPTATLFHPRRTPVPTTSGPWGLSAGKTLGDFTLIQRLGRGSMGEVWEAQQKSLGRKVALKLLLPERVDQKGLEFFAREARAGGRLAHPGIVSVFGTGKTDGLHWISMELIEDACDLRHSLEEIREESELPEGYYSQVAQFTAEVADALEAAHASDVIHRDLKPGNIMVTRDEHPKVADFGLAKLVDEHSLSLAGDMVGTYYYMSPEQVATKRAGINHRTDIFSLGVVLYEMLTLVRPFEGDTTEQVAQKILWEEAPNPSTIRSKVPRDLAVICGKAMEKDPGRRYQTMADLAADLRRHLANEPILAKPSGTLVRLQKWVRRNPTKSTAIGLLAVALVVVLNLYSRLFDEQQATQTALEQVSQEKDRAVAAEASTLKALNDLQVKTEEVKRQVYSASIHAAGTAVQVGNTSEVHRRLNDCPEELRGWEWRHLDLGCNLSLQTLEGHEDGVSSVAWNPAGTRIVSGSQDDTLRIWDAATGTSLQTLEGHRDQVISVAWNPAGTRIVSGSEDNTLHIWESRLEDAIPFWRAASLRDELHRWVDSLFNEHVFLEPVLAALHADRSHSEEMRQGAIRLAEGRGDPTVIELNEDAWDIVDPDREDKDTDVALGLRMTRVAIELAPAFDALRDTHAWALFANGLYDEALVESAKALELADEADKDDYQGYLDRMRAMVEETRSDPPTSDLPGDDR